MLLSITARLAHHIFKFSLQLTFGAGIYAGIYLCQNYQVNSQELKETIYRISLVMALVVFQIPRVDEPQIIWQKLTDFMEKHKKNPGDK